MAQIKLIDTTMRDGNQSLWGATALRTGMLLQIAPVVDRVGFEALDFISSTHMAVAVRWHKENPWERIRLMREAMPRTPLSYLTTSLRFISWEKIDPELMRLSFRLLVRNGIERFWVMDPMNDVKNILGALKMIHEEGGKEIIGALVFTLSPVHDDAFIVDRAGELAASPYVTRVCLKDSGGLLAPERARALVPALKARIGVMPLEVHSHCTLGHAPRTYVEAAELGAESLHVAVAPVANGTSEPSAERTIANLREMGHTVDVDEEALAEMSAYFAKLAAAEGLPTGAPLEYDAAFLRHQLPGGMVTTMKRQLKEMNLSHRWPDMVEEVGRVRAELGYPIMVTPFSQIVGAQAVVNVISGKRYAQVSDEVIRYVLGRFGAPTQPVDEGVKDRILSLARAQELAAEAPPPTLAEWRTKLGASMPDEELLLRAVMPADQVDAMLAAGPCRRTYDPAVRPVLTLLKELSARGPLGRVTVEKPGFRMELRAGS